MKSVYSIFLFLSMYCLAFGQDEPAPENKKQAVFLEIAGSGGLGSVNYERQFFRKKSTEFNWRAGLSFAPIDKNNGVGVVFPLMLNSVIGKKTHKIELGIGQGITITTKGSFFVLGLASIGYRFQHQSRKWFYRITYTPLISYLIDSQIQHWGGVSIGYTFKNQSK